MRGILTWADSDALVSSDTFMITKSIWDTGTYLSNLKSGTRWQHPLIRDALHWCRRFEYPWVLRKLSPQKEDIVLDAGAGPATLQFVIARYVKELHNVDIDSSVLTIIENIKKESGLWDNLITKEADIRQLPYDDNYFTKSICISVVEHLPPKDIPTALDELFRVTSGTLYLTMDVCLYTADGKPSNIIEIKEFSKMLEGLNIMVPNMPDTILTAITDKNNYIVVACMELWK